MILSGMRVSRARLSATCDVPAVVPGQSAHVATVSAEVLEETWKWNPTCKCEEIGLTAGMPVGDLIELESGCTGRNLGWVCQRLDMIRRRYGR